jgi:CBS domain-containing protein
MAHGSYHARRRNIMSVGRICTRIVVTASPDEPIAEVARRMEEYDVGTAVVVDGAKVPQAMVTDRDVTLRCVARGLDPSKTPLSVIMTRDVRTVDESTPLEQALRTMAGAGTRRLVVTGAEGKLVGVLSVDDVILLLAEEAESLGRILGRSSSPAIATAR